MENEFRRPASVWIAQILMIIGALFFLSPLLILLFVPVTISGGQIIGLVIMTAIYLGIVSLFVLAFVGMMRRRSYGRWLGVGMLSLLVLFSLLGQIVQPSGPIKRWEYGNATQAAAGFMTGLIVLGLLVWLVLALALGKRPTAFFTGIDPDAPPQIVP